MIFLAVLATATALAVLVRRHDTPRGWARIGLAVAFIVAGVAHLASPEPFEQHLPEWVPARLALVYASGIAEILLGFVLALWRSQRQQIGRITAAYLLAVWPANVYVAIAGVDVDGQPGGVYPWIRIPLQVVFIAWALWSTGHPAPTTAAEPARNVGAARP